MPGCVSTIGDMGKSKADDGPKKPNRTGVSVHVWLPKELVDAAGKFQKSQRIWPYMTDVIELALREFLEREGFAVPAKRP